MNFILSFCFEPNTYVVIFKNDTRKTNVFIDTIFPDFPFLNISWNYYDISMLIKKRTPPEDQQIEPEKMGPGSDVFFRTSRENTFSGSSR